jgi:membrane-bound serine protease (ClpP class)
MKRIRHLASIVLILLALALPSIVHAQLGAHVDVFTVNGAIDNSVDIYLDRVITVAEQDGAQAAIIVMDTPGGFLGSMKNITNRMLGARVPVVVYVYPQGAWAGSAGTFITMAANIAAMAPSTTIGAAHPVGEGGENIPTDEREKITNASVSMIQNIARARGRNADWAADAVRNSKAATAQEALDLKVIDLIATDLIDLLNKMDGKTVKTSAGDVTLQTQHVGINRFDMNISELFLHALTNANLAFLLLQIGMLAIAVELYNPGATIPAIVGGICLVLAFVALGQLPVNWGAVILIMLGIGSLILDVKVTGFALTVGGVIMIILGGLLLFTPFTPTAPSAPSFPEISVSPWVVVGSTLFTAAFFVFLLGAAVRGRNYPVLSGSEALIGAQGIATSELNPDGMVRVRGEEWTASTVGGTIHKGESVGVVAIEGLRMKVEKK